ncbi:MAG: succinylglutamate desuccinylase/aspartoacylase family protein [Planctomycetes bacterium]|nr:succinylglutamate desuccinylase/aspartoacylase family protein [Planctomycetota bacterium]
MSEPRKRKAPKPSREPFEIAGVEVASGERQLVELHLTRLYTSGDVVIPVHVVHGRRDGPRLFVSAAVHGDEINGVEAIRRLLRLRLLKNLRGTLLAIPVVNVHGFLAKTRYTPDRRDLNRSFPGTAKGSLAARVAKSFMDEVVARCTHGVDLHTGSNHRTNLPHVRANLDDDETRRLAEAFGTPVLINAKLRDGSLRQAAMEHGIPMLLFEGGEALRFQPTVTQAAVRGVVGVMVALGMLRSARRPTRAPFVASSTKWIRAPDSGLLISDLQPGMPVEANQQVGYISDPFGREETPIFAPKRGIVIGRLNLPLINEGDALFHVAYGDNVGEAEATIQEFGDQFDSELPYQPEEVIDVD